MNDVQQALERLVPEPARTPAWDVVLRDARPRRRSLTLQIAVAAGAAALVALFAVAPWRGTERAGILDRALAAVGDGPVLHVVLRDDLQSEGVLINLRTGERKRVSGTKEFWHDSGRGRVREISRFGGVVEVDAAYSLGGLGPGVRIVGPGAGSWVPEVGKFSRDYRKALEAGTARVTGRGVIEGIPVYWITLPPRTGMHVSGPQRGPRPVERVAVSRETFEPVAIEERQVGWPCKPACLTTSLRVLRMESLSTEAAELTPSPIAPGDRLASGNYEIRGSTEIPLGQAAKILGGTPVWLGPEHARLPLARTSSLFFGLETAPERAGVDFFYGQGTEGEPSISITETTDRNFAARIRNYGSPLRPGSSLGYVPPEGSVLVIRKRFGFLVRDGVYVRMEASSEKLLLGAARALRPLTAR
jgi:hypothetical protein